MNTDTALPEASEQLAGASDQLTTDAPVIETDATAEGTEAEKAPEKPAKTEEQRALDRMQRKLDRVVGQRNELRTRLGQQDLRQPPIDDTNGQQQDDSEPLSLSRAELAAMVKTEAEKLAPTIRQQQAEFEHRRGVVADLATQWGSEKFDSLAAELDEALGGLKDRSGRPRPVADAIFESDAPAALIEYLADEDNADEAEALARMTPIQVGRAIAKLESKLASTKASNKPQRSNAPAPIESGKASGASSDAGPDPSNTKAWIRWRNEQERKGL